MFLQKLWKNWNEPQPYHQGYLPTSDGHDVWFGEYGNPQGKPVLITHGGPGGCCHARRAGDFNLKAYRVIMFDQRGCGQSKPLGELKNNTTDDILFDMERLLNYLQIKEKIILRGASWASTIALLFAERHPEKIEKLILSQIFLADDVNEKWEQEGCALFYPDMMEQLRSPLKKWQTISEYYLTQLTSDDEKQQKQALETYGRFERVVGALSPHWGRVDAIDEKELKSMQIYAQYAVHHYYLKSNEIMRKVRKITNIPTLIVHNRLDMLCPLQGAYELAKKLEKCKLVIVPEKGHIGKLLYKTVKSEIRTFL
ncbi:MAG: alpha/beta fold hydrolase [Alphaproteobacteria bacterium]|nr:alpha/beta fold hydrolase [Alphaproteobacteria bacterium]